MSWMLQIAISPPTWNSAVSELILDKEATTAEKAQAIWTKQGISRRLISSWCRPSSTPSSTWAVVNNKPCPLPTLRSINLSSSSLACWAAETGAQTPLESEHTLIWKTSIRNQLESRSVRTASCCTRWHNQVRITRPSQRVRLWIKRRSSPVLSLEREQTP